MIPSAIVFYFIYLLTYLQKQTENVMVFIFLELVKFLSSRKVVEILAILLLEVLKLSCLKECGLHLSENFSFYESAIGKCGFKMDK